MAVRHVGPEHAEEPILKLQKLFFACSAANSIAREFLPFLSYGLPPIST
jgi:hypothetical protein